MHTTAILSRLNLTAPGPARTPKARFPCRLMASWSIQTNGGVQATVDASGGVTSIMGAEKSELQAPKVPTKPAKAKTEAVQPVQPK